MNTLFLYAPTLRSKGGLRVLCQAINALYCKHRFIYVFAPSLPSSIVLKLYPNLFFFPTTTFLSRIKAQFFILHNSSYSDVCLCLCNYPPLLRVPARIVLFLHNRLIFDPSIRLYLSFSQRFLLFIKRRYLLILSNRISSILVQTKSFKDLLRNNFPSSIPVSLYNFPSGMPNGGNCLRSFSLPGKHKIFLYPATFEPHKNHLNLILAWVSLCSLYSLDACLVLTIELDDIRSLLNSVVIAQLSKLVESRSIIFLGDVSSDCIATLYGLSDCLVYPSFCESLGLPLVESTSYSLDVVASNLPYVYDSIVPAEVFCPYSVDSIVYALIRYLGLKEEVDVPRLDDFSSFA